MKTFIVCILPRSDNKLISYLKQRQMRSLLARKVRFREFTHLALKEIDMEVRLPRRGFSSLGQTHATD